MELSRVEISSDSKWNRRYLVTIDKFAGFPKCIAGIVAEYCMGLKLLDWIDQDRLDMRKLCANPRAIESGMIDPRYADRHHITFNSAAAEYIQSHWNDFSGYVTLWANPNMFEWMIAHWSEQDERDNPIIKWLYLRDNPNPDAIRYILKHNENGIDGISLCNPSITMCGSWEHIIANTPNQKLSSLYANPSAMELCDDCLDDDTNSELSKNPHPRAIEYLRTHQDEIYWGWFSKNPGIFEYRVDPELVVVLSE